MCDPGPLCGHGSIGILERQLKAAKIAFRNRGRRSAWRGMPSTPRAWPCPKPTGAACRRPCIPTVNWSECAKRLLDKAAQIINPLFDALPVPGE